MPCGGLNRPKSAYLCRGAALYRLLRELIVLSVLYEAMLVPLDAMLGLYVRESVSVKESVSESGISSVVEAVILISSNENLCWFTRKFSSITRVDGETAQPQ